MKKVEFKNYVKENNSKILQQFEDYRNEKIPDVVDNYDWEDQIEITGCETADEWYDSYGYTTGCQAEYFAAESILRDLKVDEGNDEELQVWLIEVMGYSMD